MQSARVTAYAPRSTMSPHTHDDLSLIIVLRGSYLERIAGRDAEHGIGRMLVYPAHASHSQQLGPGGAQKLVLTPNVATRECLTEHGVRLDVPLYREPTDAHGLALRAQLEIRRSDPFAAFALDGIAAELAAVFARAGRASTPGRPLFGFAKSVT
jgi:AraC family transcriptional regulator